MVLYEDTRQQIHAGDKHKNIHDHCKRAGIDVVRAALPFGDYCLSDNLEDKEFTYTGRDEDGNPVEKTVIKKVPIKGSVLVDSKKDLLEISGNLASRDHRRIRDEMIRAQEAGCQLVFLIEEIPPCGMIDLWVPPVFQSTTRYHRAGQPVTRANPVLLHKMMETMTKKYGAKFIFCDRSQTGRILISILTGEYRV